MERPEKSVSDPRLALSSLFLPSEFKTQRWANCLTGGPEWILTSGEKDLSKEMEENMHDNRISPTGFSSLLKPLFKH